MCRYHLAIVFAGAALFSASAMAQEMENGATASTASAAASPASATTQDSQTAENNAQYLAEILCRDEPPPIGTRVGGGRVCKTRREWRFEEDYRNRQQGLQDQMRPNIVAGSTGAGRGS